MEVRKRLDPHHNVWMLEPDNNTLCTTVLPDAGQSKQINTCYIKKKICRKEIKHTSVMFTLYLLLNLVYFIFKIYGDNTL